ncbi:MAG: DUF4292 domain-containing protein [Barnesiella sp.]|nr:DUF4292 domain-containing protein [Barnesiella sp.]
MNISLKYTLFLRSLTVCLSSLLLVGIASCGSSKNVATQPAAVSSSPTLQSDADIDRQLSAVIGSYGSWQRLRVPVTVEINRPKNISISGTAIMERDKSVMIMLKYFGFEVGSLYLTSDSVTVIDKIHKSYAKESIRSFLSGFNVSVANVQDILLGRLFVPGQPTASVSAFDKAEKERVSADEWILIPRGALKGVDYGFRFSPADLLSALICQSGANPPVTCVYDTPVSTPAGPMSAEISVSYERGKSVIDASLQWNLSKAKWNGDVDLRVPSIGKDYKRISSSDISKIISKL